MVSNYIYISIGIFTKKYKKIYNNCNIDNN